MGISKKTPRKMEAWLEKRIVAIWTNLQTNHLWQRMLKNTLATTIAVIIALIPAVVHVYGKAAYLAPIVTVFGHPGRRFGMMAEALVLTICGTVLGIGWSALGVYLSSLVYGTNAPAAYTIKGIFLVVALMVHGLLRSHTPRLFLFVVLIVIVNVVTLTSTAIAVTKTTFTQILYPILTSVGLLLLVNMSVFPEFSSSFLGITTIETLGETVGALRDAGKYFIDMGDAQKVEKDIKNREGTEPLTKTATLAEKPAQKSKGNADTEILRKFLNIFRVSKEGPDTVDDEVHDRVKLKSLTDSKGTLRAKLANCKAAQQECNFEIAWAVLPPRELKSISDTHMRLLVANTIALIGACESKYALMGDKDDEDGEDKNKEHLKALEEEANIKSEDEDSSRPGTGDEDEKRHARGARKKEKRKKSRQKSKARLEKEIEDLELVKPRKEIEFGDIELLKYLVNRISEPLANLQEKIDRSVDVVTASLAYCYDVPKLPSGARPPTGIKLEEIDIRVDVLTDALDEFDRDSAFALESAAALDDLEHPQLDIMPRMETFLISSFLLNLRQTALHIREMLRHSRIIVEKRQARDGRRRLWAPKINWRKWLMSGGEEDAFALPESGRKEARTGKKEDDVHDQDSESTSKESLLIKKDIESVSPKTTLAPEKKKRSEQPPKRKPRTLDKTTFMHRFRNGLADMIEYVSGSEDISYAVKLTVAVFLVTWPAFLHKWNAWYSLNRGLWAALQLVLITEVALGTSVMTFMLRGIGTTIGCVWGYAAYQAGNGNRIICVVILIIGIIPSTYVQLGSKYVKAGMVSIISMCIVALATVDGTAPESATKNFLKRFIAFLIGGVVALIVEVVLFPVRARDRLVESLAASIVQLTEMEACLAYGIEAETNVDVHSAAVSDRFDRAKSKVEGALAAAETFLPFCANEPRLKGSFKGLSLVYAEILYVLHAIVDRMDNMLHLRQEYGSGVLEELNTQVFPYRRNVAGCVTLILFAVHEALTTKLPLPQFLPSARLAHLRMVNRVREVVLAKTTSELDRSQDSGRSEIEMMMVKRLVRQKFLSWNAASAGQIEVIEYLEELIDLVKLLVGANEFRSGLLTRPTYREYVDRIGRGIENQHGNLMDEEQAELRDAVPQQPREKETNSRLTKRRSPLSKRNEVAKEKKLPSDEEETEKPKHAEEQLPRPLQRVRTRRVEERNLRLDKSRSKEADVKRNGKRADKSE